MHVWGLIIGNINYTDLHKPEQPTFEDVTDTDRKDVIRLRINHNNICFTNHTFVPHVADNCSITEGYTFEFNKIMEIPFNRMPQGTACQFSVTAVCRSNSNIRSEPKRRTVFLRSDIRSGIFFQTWKSCLLYFCVWFMPTYPPPGSGSVQRSSVACIVSSLFAVIIISDFRLLLSFYM